MLVVERAKKCLDFTATLYLLHLLFCCAYRGWPRSAEWWVVNLLGLALMAVLGEWLCLRKEMRDIPLITRRAARAGACPHACSVRATDKYPLRCWARSGVGGQAQRQPQTGPGRGLLALSALASTGRMLSGGLGMARDTAAAP